MQYEGRRRFLAPVVVAVFALTVICCAALAIKLHQSRIHPLPSTIQKSSPDWSAPKGASRLAIGPGPLIEVPEPLTWGAILLSVLGLRILQMRRQRRSGFFRNQQVLR